MKEMNAIRLAFEVKQNGEKQPPGYNFVDRFVNIGHKDRLLEKGAISCKRGPNCTTLFYYLLICCIKRKRQDSVPCSGAEQSRDHRV